MQTTTKPALDHRPAAVPPVSGAYLCPQCRQPLAALRCGPCGLTVESDSGILDFISCNPSHRALQEEVDYWDEHVEEFPTCRLRKHTDTVQDYFRGKSFNKSAHRMLPELKDIDLRDKTCMEVGGTGHSLAMMLRSGCKDLYHVEVSKQTQRIAQQNIRQLSFGHDAKIRYLCSPAESIPLPDDTLDLVMAFGTYHHTKRPESLIEVHRVLKPGGIVYLHECYIGPVLTPAKVVTRALRRPWGFEPGNDDPLRLTDVWSLKRLFPRHHFELRNVLDPLGFLLRYIHQPAAEKVYRQELDLPGVTPVASVFSKGCLFFSGKKAAEEQ